MNVLPDITKFKEIAFDTETTGLYPHDGDRVFGFSLSLPDGSDHYFDIREQPEAVNKLNDMMFKYKGDIICHNISFDYRQSHATDIHWNLKQGIDTCINACLLNEHESNYSLDNLSSKYTDRPKQGDELYRQLADRFGGRATRNVQMSRLQQAPVDIVAPYAKADTRATLELHKVQKRDINKQNLGRIVAFERKLTPVMVAAEMHGVRIDIRAAERAVMQLTPIIKDEQKKLNNIVGFKCNPYPSQDIKRIFKPTWKEGQWWACDGTPLRETKAGAASISAEALRGMSHPAAAQILSLRQLMKTRDTFLLGHILESAVNGRVYPTINQGKTPEGGTGTGRLSMSNPALQQIPDRNPEVAAIVKKIFLPDEGHTWVDCDLASFEVRIFAHLVGTDDIVQCYREDPEMDFHQFVADITGLVRNPIYGGQPNAKQLNLSMIFNQGNGETANKMGLPWKWTSFTPADSVEGKMVTYKKSGPEAMKIINQYHHKLPGVKKLAEGCEEIAATRNWLFTKRGRHIRFPKGYKAYKASGLLIQATAADENKENWLRIDEALKGTGAKMLLNTHDSYSLSIPKGQEEVVARKVKNAIESPRDLRVPLVLEVQKPGNSWWDSKKAGRWM